MPDKPAKPDLEQIREDRRRAQRAAEDALAVAQEAGRAYEGIQRDLVASDRDMQQHLRVLRKARIL